MLWRIPQKGWRLVGLECIEKEKEEAKKVLNLCCTQARAHGLSQAACAHISEQRNEKGLKLGMHHRTYAHILYYTYIYTSPLGIVNPVVVDKDRLRLATGMTSMEININTPAKHSINQCSALNEGAGHHFLHAPSQEGHKLSGAALQLSVGAVAPFVHAQLLCLRLHFYAHPRVGYRRCELEKRQWDWGDVRARGEVAMWRKLQCWRHACMYTHICTI